MQRREFMKTAMWDFSWLLRRHPAGEFHDWDIIKESAEIAAEPG